MTVQTLGTVTVDGRVLQMLSLPAAELAEGDIVAGETWREIEYLLVYQGEYGPEVNMVTTPVGGGSPTEPYWVAADRRFAVLRPEAVSR